MSRPASALFTRRTLRSLCRNPAIDFFYSKSPPSRSFTHKASLLLVARPIPRPQLPFLHPISRAHNAQTQLGRFISTERKQRWKEQLWRQLRFHAYLWPSVLLAVILMLGVQHTKLERDYPTPREWTFWSRWILRDAKHTEFGEGAKVQRVLTDWEKAGYLYTEVIKRLESEKYDGQNLLLSEASGSYADSLGIVGFDISAKSEQWRRGYHEALMGAGRAAEHLDGMCKRKGQVRGRVYPRESIPGPDNPRPKPLPWDKNKGHENVPHADEVEDAFPPPETFYLKVLTTNGFDTRQRLEAAMAYADWCDFKGLTQTAEEAYRWALDIAQSGVPGGVSDVVDTRTGVINKDKETAVTENILKACTALGVHYAQTGDVRQALPVFLSVLRARKSLPPPPSGPLKELTGSGSGFGKRSQQKDEQEGPHGIWPYLDALKDLVIERPYPPPPPSGNERPFHSLKEACEEVGLMTYIGEILFATSEGEREKGLSWTRDSVEAAEAVMWVMEERKEEDGKDRCRECLETGLQNWKTMARHMSRLAAQREQEIANSSGLLGLGIGKAKQLERARQEKQRWQEEDLQIELRKEKTMPLRQPLKPLSGGLMSTYL
ncbi:hypothetical protein HRR83_009192 [Exophiala dermatitidis]|uniref:MFS maltose permease n=2 Tax=Exophiala dermatitidis TaxID=5970 RepID=H6BUR7_EXODN|nr:uncharacterized protein HMPREF1120_03878 [Exophiala dermatitidis NIH/UT8656]KAJ4502243.1 hypothetical protein HRR75_008572 [Exophiala dermatitidis]EHY55754.1 hypothetical protein HMPREF1120_03878 [Exophiala dermatitidis NIH/UT8656]KAJ4502994.1 hypothetical protein HRR73_009268 [Exophiala dermatitidis]KAJ4503417.1 hypothetical protein HRR74_009324 [Exophiala dermatitidis]KAJ4535438.1 hypothetical protein HRR77_008053 [Exophiala dermatitidis]